MKFSSLVNRVAGKSTDVWETHYEAIARIRDGQDIILLSVGQESDQLTDSRIVEAAVQSLRSGRHHYGPIQGEHDLRNEIAKRHFELTRQSVSEKQCAVFSGAQNALFSVSQCVLDHGDEVILIEPYYSTYPATFSSGGAKLITVPACPTKKMQMEPEAVIDAITDKTRAIVVNSPNNPIGSVYTKEQYEPIVKACIDRKIWLISDEVYLEMLAPRARVSPAVLPGADEICITVSSLSKSHRMTGWRFGWAVGPTKLIEHLYNLSLCMSYGLPSFILDAAVFALKIDANIAESVRENMDRRRKIAMDCLSNLPSIKILEAAGGMFVVLDVRNTGISSMEFTRQLLDQQQVSVLPCDGSGDSFEGFVRISLGIEDRLFEEACHRIQSFALSLPNTGITHQNN
ncbi:MAG: pyridoxal phosphate-dependent aminotransferase [Gammaproteobacteria bacterium]|nr:pyridoxal phosphate-dependent aminotransferase [Gammaproteobacteria bacterium]MCY4274943.1 pyridoxal phosphate-dependent aminotransferase [Gammaproteobacteria bacterium]